MRVFILILMGCNGVTEIKGNSALMRFPKWYPSRFLQPNKSGAGWLRLMGISNINENPRNIKFRGLYTFKSNLLPGDSEIGFPKILINR